MSPVALSLDTLSNNQGAISEDDRIVKAVIRQLSGSFTNKQGGYKLELPEQMFVAGSPEIVSESNPNTQGTLLIGFTDDLNRSSIQINYGIPKLSAKEGGESTNSAFKLNGVSATKSTFTKGDSELYHIAYPTNPNQKIEYSIYIRGSQTEKERYLEIIQKGFSWL